MRSLRVPRLLIVAGALLVGLTTSACEANDPDTTGKDTGIAALSADEIMSRMLVAYDNATSFRFVGEVGGGGSGVTFDLRQRDHSDGICTQTIDGATIETTRISSDVFIKADDQVWTDAEPFGSKTASLLPSLHGRYLKANAYVDAARRMTRCLDLPQVIRRSLAKIEDVAKGPMSTVNGVPVIRIDPADGGSLYVATVGEPYPVRVEAEGLSLDYSDYNRPVDIVAPPADQVVDLATLI